MRTHALECKTAFKASPECEDGFAHRCIETVVAEKVLVGNAPEFSGNEFSIALRGRSALGAQMLGTNSATTCREKMCWQKQIESGYTVS